MCKPDLCALVYERCYGHTNSINQIFHTEMFTYYLPYIQRQLEADRPLYL